MRKVSIGSVQHGGLGELLKLKHVREARYAVEYNIDDCSWLYEGTFDESSLTTNGVLLSRQAKALAEAGLSRIKVSLDSLVREKFARLTRRDQLDRVLESLEELEKYPSIHPIKVNTVAWRSYSEEEAFDFVRLAPRQAYVTRWIEFMPLDTDQIWRKKDILTGAELKAIIEAEYGPLVPITNSDSSETARRYTFSDGR